MSILWLKQQPKVKLCKPLGSVPSMRLWSNSLPTVKLCKPLGKVTFFMFWSNASPNVKLCKPLGKVTLSMLWLNAPPNVKLFKPLGKVSNILHAVVEAIAKGQALQAAGQCHILHAQSPKVKLCKLLGNVTFSMLWLN